MPKYPPFPLVDKAVEMIKASTGLTDTDEACQPKVVREFFDQLASNIPTSPVEKVDQAIEHNGVKVDISVLRPVGSADKVLPVIMFLHGGGWVTGSYHSHGILTNLLVNLLQCCVVFVHYSLSPEAKYPVALEECYATLCWIQENGASIYVDPKSIVVSGDSAGGNLAAALTILAKERGNNGVTYQVLYYPVVDVDFENESYQQNKNDPFLPARTMHYVWQCYTNPDQHKIPAVVPMSSSLDVLKNLPPALVITAEKDVLRSEGELYAKRLTEAGVPTISVRYFNTGHGFVTMPFLRPQGHAAIAQTVNILQKHWNRKSNL